MRKAALVATICLTGTVLAASAVRGANDAPQPGDVFTATASLKTAGGTSVAAPVTITITRWTSDEERTKALAALKTGGAALKTALDGMPETGTLQIGGRTTPLRYARALPTAGGKLVTIVTTQPILFVGAGVPEAKPKTGYEFGFATFEIDASGKGTAGDLAPAAKLKIGQQDAVVVDDYGAEAVRLTQISSK